LWCFDSLIILFAFGATFHLLLRKNNAAAYASLGRFNVTDAAATVDEDDEAMAGGMFDDTVMAFVAVYDMMYGAFDIEIFRAAPVWPAVAVFDFLLFMLLVPTVMLNALIAFMNGTYEKVDANQTETMLTEKLSLILEFESSMKFVPGHREIGKWEKQLRAVCTATVPFSNREPYLHLLGPQATTAAAEMQARRRYRRERDMQREVIDVSTRKQSACASQPSLDFREMSLRACLFACADRSRSSSCNWRAS